MILVNVVDGIIKKYPYFLSDLKNDNPNVSFPDRISEEVLKYFNCYLVEDTPLPKIENGVSVVEEGLPECIDGAWKKTWKVVSHNVGID